jgi:hypothetical protein
VSHCLGKAYQEIGKLEGALQRRADTTPGSAFGMGCF